MILRADARHIPLADGVVQTVVSSPPYWGLRDYGTARWEGGDAVCDHTISKANERKMLNGRGELGNSMTAWTHYDQTPTAGDCPKCGARRIDSQIGLEPTPEAYVATMVGVMREVWRVLKDDGTVWLNLGDSYAAARSYQVPDSKWRDVGNTQPSQVPSGLKPKDLCGMPWRVAFALQTDGWYLRSDIVWAKPNPMPESVTDRPTRSHEYIFLLTKAPRYYYDSEAIRELAEYGRRDTAGQWRGGAYVNQKGAQDNSNGNGGFNSVTGKHPETGRNKRDVWTVNSEPTPEAHFATFPQKLIEPCILAGTSERGECVRCGKNWVRVTESHIEHSQRIHNGAKYGGEGAFGNQAANRHRDGHLPGTKNVTTTGWRPQCACDAPTRPNIVLDPFIGSGTVGKVCERFGRRWVGLELSAEYIAIARRRSAQLGLRL